MKYKALCLPSDRDDTCSFDSEEEALEFIKTRLCPSCLEELKRGFMIFDDGEKEEISSPFDTLCGAEWMVVVE